MDVPGPSLLGSESGTGPVPSADGAGCGSRTKPSPDGDGAGLWNSDAARHGPVNSRSHVAVRGRTGATGWSAAPPRPVYRGRLWTRACPRSYAGRHRTESAGIAAVLKNRKAEEDADPVT